MNDATVFPTLKYENAAAAIDFLVSAFGAEPYAVYKGDGDKIQHAELRFGNGLVMLGSAGPDRGVTPGAIYVVVDDPDAHAQRARAAGAAITREVADTEYGSRGYSAGDPEGNEWHFGTYQPFDEVEH